MTRRRSLGSQLYSLARTSTNGRALTGRELSAYPSVGYVGKVYGEEMGLTRSILKAFGLSK